MTARTGRLGRRRCPSSSAARTFAHVPVEVAAHRPPAVDEPVAVGRRLERLERGEVQELRPAVRRAGRPPSGRDRPRPGRAPSRGSASSAVRVTASPGVEVVGSGSPAPARARPPSRRPLGAPAPPVEMSARRSSKRRSPIEVATIGLRGQRPVPGLARRAGSRSAPTPVALAGVRSSAVIGCMRPVDTVRGRADRRAGPGRRRRPGARA